MQSDHETNAGLVELGFAVPAKQLAGLLGISLAGLRIAVKNADPPMAKVQDGTPLTWAVVEAVLLELGFAQKTAAGELEGAGGFDMRDFMEKARGGAVAQRGEAIAVPDEAVSVTLVAACPNPLFWRAKLKTAAGTRMVTLKEPLSVKRGRFRPGLSVRAWPLPFPKDHFTTVKP